MNDNNVTVLSDLSSTNFFVYKGKRYPFNIVLFNLFSQYFISNEQPVQPNSEITLLEELEDTINITESSIKDFINFFSFSLISTDFCKYSDNGCPSKISPSIGS